MNIEIKLVTGARITYREVESVELFQGDYNVSHWIPIEEGSSCKELVFNRFPITMVDRFTIINFEP